jgi:hypothetical protein
MRKQHVGHLTNYRREPKTDRFCAVCQKDMKDEPRRWVHMIDGGPTVLHPEDEHLYTPDGGDLGSWPVGPECAKKIGKEWIHGGD